MFLLYIFLFGLFQILSGLLEFIFPAKFYSVLRRWINSRYYFLHGLFLIATGFPLTVYDGRFSTALFIIGIIIVFTGPVVLFYPEKIREIFDSAERDLGKENVTGIMKTEAFFRIAAGTVMVISFFFNTI